MEDISLVEKGKPDEIRGGEEVNTRLQTKINNAVPGRQCLEYWATKASRSNHSKEIGRFMHFGGNVGGKRSYVLLSQLTEKSS